MINLPISHTIVHLFCARAVKDTGEEQQIPPNTEPAVCLLGCQAFVKS